MTDPASSSPVRSLQVSLSQIRSQAAAVLERWPERRRIGLRVPGPWSGPSKLELEWTSQGRTIREEARVTWCRSTLELRQGLLESETSGEIRIFLADLPPTELGDDFADRLAKGRLLELDRWATVERLFEARDSDPRLSRQGWIADLLIEAAPPGGYRPVASGVLDESTARAALLERCLGLGELDMSPAALLRWASASGAQERFDASPPALREHLSSWLAPAAGPLAEVLVALFEAGHGGDGVAVGLVAEAVAGPASASAPPLPYVVLSERYLGQHRPGPEAVATWAAAAGEAVRRRHDADGFGAVEPWLRRAEAVLEEVTADADTAAAALASDWLLHSFEERLAGAARSVEHWLGGDAEAREQAEAWASGLRRHHLSSRRHDHRVETLERALALVRWLEAPPAEAPHLAAAALDYADDGAWVDLARQQVGRGDTASRVEEVYAALLERVESEREARNRRFAELLGSAGAEVPADARLAGVEDVLERWAAPLVRRRPLLVLVLDGLGQVVWRQLAPSLWPRGWRELVPAAGRAAALAVLPTETRTSRTSLLCGRLAAGTSSDERRGFAAHPALVAAGGTPPPRLFAPGELKSEGGGVAPELADEIRSGRRVVGAVLPDVDALFESGSDLRSSFDADAVGPLGALLQLAAEAGRVVLVTGDHGQVPGGATRLCRRDARTTISGERRGRYHFEAPAEGEVRVGGRRVLTERQEIVAAWSERLRYRKGGRTGYHGGVSPCEVVVPVAVLARRGVEVEGWRAEGGELPPAWWETPRRAPASSSSPSSPSSGRAKRRRRERRPEPSPRAAPAQLSLLAPAGEASGDDWLDRLLASEVYAQQRSLAGRRPPSEVQVRRLLSALDAEGGTLTLAALGRRLETTRLRGLLSQASRLLNVDGYGVLSLDDASQTVRLDRALLEKQFALSEGNG